MSQAGVVDAAAAASTAAYDLTRKSDVGQTVHYKHTDVYLTIGEGGVVQRTETVTGCYVEEVADVRPDGARVVNWVRDGLQLQADDEPAQPLSESHGARETICFEDDWTLLPVNPEPFPKDLTGMLQIEHMIHSGFFPFWTSKAHGGIQNLRTPGDSIVMPTTGDVVALEFGGFVNIEAHRGESTLTFRGIGNVGGRPSAFLTVWMPQTFVKLNGGTGTGDVHGHVSVDLEDGSVLGGYFQQTNYIVIPFGGNNMVINQIVRGTLERIDPSQYPA